MGKLKRVAFATGSRADYGIMRRFLRLLDDDPEVDLEILVTGALLEDAWGHQVDLVRADGFKVGAEIPIGVDVTSDFTVARSMACALEGFADLFERDRPDLLMVLGDRYEMLSVVTAAAMQRVPILHIHGGEATWANYDEFIRHAITKMSLYHFTATDEYRKRVVQLGENPKRVFNLGALGAENCLDIDEAAVPEVVRALPDRGYLVVLFHPETISGVDSCTQASELLDALAGVVGKKLVFIGSNADTHSDEIRAAVRSFVDSRSGAFYFENLPTAGYHYLVGHACCLVGNSSSGLIEAPSLGAYTVNVGHRQDGRVRGESVIDVPCESDAILSGIERAMSMPTPFVGVNPYYQERCAERYYEITKILLARVTEDAAQAKEFFDLSFDPNAVAR